MSFWESGWFIWGVLPVLIFLARILDVSVGTMRILFVVRGSKLIAALLGFVEVFVWIVVVSQIMSEHTGLLHYMAYAAGFATGSVVGITIESRLALGMQTIRVITGEPTHELEQDLLRNGYGATRLVGEGLRGGARAILYSTMPRQKVPDAVALVERHLPRAFLSVEDVKSIRQGYFPMREDSALVLRLLPFMRKGK